MGADILEKIEKELENKLSTRVGFVESEHPQEVIKGARLAATIIREELTRQGVLKPK